MPEDALSALKQRWLTTGSFADEQAYLAARVRLNDVRFVYLDPDGTAPEWLTLVMRSDTGVVYGTQCAGLATEQRFVEGYLVLLGGSKYNLDDGPIDVPALRDVFHEGDACKWGWAGSVLPSERQAQLSRLVEGIPYWQCDMHEPGRKYSISLDTARLAEVAEAWIPVRTPDGPGVLLYQNCD